ncbi:hypothetical protein U0070_012791 [Myodes glareolus]|uniref:Uncharacterized protein n=1 Tax=Myodes glareolus TaxID=447135 RepID=A0AAW0I7Q9_MYOGA
MLSGLACPAARSLSCYSELPAGKFTLTLPGCLPPVAESEKYFRLYCSSELGLAGGAELAREMLLLPKRVGTILGFALRPYKMSYREVKYFSFPGELLMRMLQMLVLPLIISSLVTVMDTGKYFLQQEKEQG